MNMLRVLASIIKIESDSGSMKIRFLLVICGIVAAIVSCQQTGNNSSAEQDIVTEQRPTGPYAEVNVPLKVDMGTFEGDELVKTATLQLGNIGTDTLYVLGVEPECDCVQILDYTSKVAPHVNGHVTVQFDVSEYSDTVRKVFGIISNDRLERVKRVTLFGVRK